MRVSIYSIAN